MIVLWRPTDARLNELARDAADAAYTYPDVGATRNGKLPTRYRTVGARTRLGAGDEVFALAADGVLAWQVQRAAGMRVVATSQRVEPDAVVVTTMGFGPVRLAIPCRVVYVVDTPEAVGFGYGTLPGHPASGEEAFVVERDPDGSVFLRVTAFSRPQGLLARLGQPVSRVVQDQVTARYLDGMRRYVAAP